MLSLSSFDHIRRQLGSEISRFAPIIVTVIDGFGCHTEILNFLQIIINVLLTRCCRCRRHIVSCIFDYRFVTILVRRIGHSLDSAVGKFNFILAEGGLRGLGLGVGEVVAGEVV